MPVYEYIENGKRVLRKLPVAARDNFPGRVTVPSRVNVCPRGEPTQGDEVLRGFSRCEDRYGTEQVRQTAKALGLSRDQVKKVWAKDD
jgi:hypothetical protein